MDAIDLLRTATECQVLGTHHLANAADAPYGETRSSRPPVS